MKAVLLAGGLGTRIAEETGTRPKPMVEIGGFPILWHIMKIYSSHGVNEFIICLGYKGHMIKEYFANYFLHTSDVTFDMKHGGNMQIHRNQSEPWKVTLVDTGPDTMTGGRLKRVAEHLGNETFCFTYGDGVSDIDIKKSIAFHKEQGRKATITIVQPPGRFGSVDFKDGQVDAFVEKPAGDNNWINGGFFVLEPSVMDYIDSDDQMWEHAPLDRICKDGELSAFKHEGFWQPMDALRDKMKLEDLWASGAPPWKVWKD